MRFVPLSLALRFSLRSAFLLFFLGSFSGLIWAQTPTTSPATEYANALVLFQTGVYQRAYEAFRAFEQQNPDHPNAAESHYYQAEALLALGKTQEAAPLYASFANRYPNHPFGEKAHMVLGQYYFEQEEYAKSRSAFGGVFQNQKDPELAAEALYWMGLNSLRLNEADIALDYFEQTYIRYPNTQIAPQALYLVGKTELERKNYARASEHFDLLATRYPLSDFTGKTALASMEANFELGRYERVLGEGDKRLSFFTGRDLERALMILGESASQLNDMGRAQYYFTQLNNNFPRSPYTRFANFGLGWTYLQQKQYGIAAGLFRASQQDLKDNLAHKAAYYEAAATLLSGDERTAREGFSDVIALWPQGEFTDQALFELGLLEYKAQRWDEAARYLNQLVTAFPASNRTGDAYLYLGESFALLGDTNRANAAFEQAMRQTNLTASARNQLSYRKGWLLYQNKNFAEAQAAFGTAFTTTNAGEALFWQAESLVQQGKYNEAERLLNQYIAGYKQDPNVNSAHYVLGWIYFNSQRYELAARSFETFLNNFRPTVNQEAYRTDAQMRLGDSYYAMKRFDDAVMAYRKVGNQGTVYALFQIGQAYMNSGQDADAINAFRRLVGNYPNSEWAPEAQYLVGSVLLQQEKYDLAINEFFNALRFYPQSAEAAKAQYGIGDAYFNQDRFNEAINAYKEVVNRYPQSPVVPDALMGIQLSYLALNQPGNAEALIDQYLRQNPGTDVADQVRFKQAEMQFQNGETQKALTGFQYFLQANRNPNLAPAATYYVGASYYQLRDYRNAEQYLRLVLDRYPSEPAAYESARLLANLFLATNRPAEALSLYKRLEANADGDISEIGEAKIGQAQAMIALNDTDGARQLLEQVSTQYANSDAGKTALLRLAALNVQLNNLTAALDQYRRIAQTNDDAFASEAQFKYGSLLLQMNRAQEALQAFTAIQQRFPEVIDWVAQSYLGQARAYKALGNRNSALQAYDRVITEYGDTPYAQVARSEKATL
ncbi:MAG: tetratricopeptide repeat protein [Rhodothermia bacterium]|nr:tetratricopeptide repeat protein [Rhodothermia bacterium]